MKEVLMLNLKKLHDHSNQNSPDVLSRIFSNQEWKDNEYYFVIIYFVL